MAQVPGQVVGQVAGVLAQVPGQVVSGVVGALVSQVPALGAINNAVGTFNNALGVANNALYVANSGLGVLQRAANGAAVLADEAVAARKAYSAVHGRDMLPLSSMSQAERVAALEAIADGAIAQGSGAPQGARYGQQWGR